MSASLVGSEMCIRDRCKACLVVEAADAVPGICSQELQMPDIACRNGDGSCLLYTSDAADDM
eukprot:9943200-Alexandrium_andersonii.AAC.1